MDTWKVLQKRGADVPPLQCGGNAALSVNQREEVCVRVQLTDGLEHLFPAPVPNQPIVDDRDLHWLGVVSRRESGDRQVCLVVTDDLK